MKISPVNKQNEDVNAFFQNIQMNADEKKKKEREDLDKKIALLTGNLPPEHGVKRLGDNAELESQLQEKAEKHSIPTEMVVEDTRFNFDFEEYHKEAIIKKTDEKGSRYFIL